MSRSTAPNRLQRAILRTVAYSDVFDYPLTGAELHRYLEGVAATPSEIGAALPGLAGALVRDRNGLVALAGRDHLFEVRRRKTLEAARQWPAARQWARRLGRLPLVRMVAVTGALAVDNAGPDADVDLLIVTEPGRVWLCRSLVIQAVRAARLGGTVLCPNWLLAADTLVLADRSLFAARELAQMVPVVGHDVYRRMRRLNAWTDRLLPNAASPPGRTEADAGGRRGVLVQTVERVVLGRLGSPLESWERRRKTREILGSGRDTNEVVLDHRQCKGHVDAHGDRIRRAYADRLRALGIDPGPGSDATS